MIITMRMGKEICFTDFSTRLDCKIIAAVDTEAYNAYSLDVGRRGKPI